jgi:hypothetical protein
MRYLRRCRLAVLAVLGVAPLVLPASHAAAPHGVGEARNATDAKPHDYELRLLCDRTYLAGFPLIVGVEVKNVSTNRHTLIRYIDLFSATGPVFFTLRGRGHEWTWPTKSHSNDDDSGQEPFRPGDTWQALQDLSNLHPDIPAGHYELSASLLFPGEMVEAKPVRIQIRRSSQADHAIAAKLRTGGRHPAGWNTFVLDNWSTPAAVGLSRPARAALAYYLFLHRAIYGPQGIAALDPEAPRHFAHGILEGEASVIRLEILHAAQRPEAAGLQKAILERWPGIAWRVKDIAEGGGMLKDLRRTYGAESSYGRRHQPGPYEKGR